MISRPFAGIVSPLDDSHLNDLTVTTYNWRHRLELKNILEKERREVQRQALIRGAEALESGDLDQDEETAEVVEDLLLKKIQAFGDMYQYGSPD